MLNRMSKLFAGVAFLIAVFSSGFASGSGMHQMKEPEALKQLSKK